MSAFELQDNPVMAQGIEHGHGGQKDDRRVRDECIVAYKVYDSCRRQNCLTVRELGPARSAEGRREECHADEFSHDAGDIITPPPHAASVTMDDVKIKKIQVVDKQPSPFRVGYWDIDIKYVFEYYLTFRETGDGPATRMKGTNVFNMKTTLFGSVGGDLVIGTDLYGESRGSTFTAAPFTWVEAKAIGLDAKIHRHRGDREVHVIIGLFSILKLVRLVNLNVQSRGFCIPEECKNQGDINPCEYFAELEFPTDIFAPPRLKD